MRYIKKVLAALFALLILLCLSACAAEQPEQTTAPTRGNRPILPGFSDTQPSSNDFTAVYVSVYEDTAIIAAYPILEYMGEEPECPPRDLSDGNGILCGCDHEKEHPITRVLITGKLVPRTMVGWFRNMVHLETIEGINNLNTQHVTDMNHLFAGCEKLEELKIDHWDVSNVKDMTGIFDGCSAITELPSWYPLEDRGNLG